MFFLRRKPKHREAKYLPRGHTANEERRLWNPGWSGPQIHHLDTSTLLLLHRDYLCPFRILSRTLLGEWALTYDTIAQILGSTVVSKASLLAGVYGVVPGLTSSSCISSP